jgi:4-amino-4-deoxy-L-arabinose transferase-like glycosyltransferase
MVKWRQDIPSTVFLGLSLLTLLVNATALFRPMISTGDSVIYAALSQHMALSGDWLDLQLNGLDWLDKPHWPFWVTAASFALLGIHAPAYVLPGMLCHWIGAFYTYRLARVLFDRRAAALALLVYSTAFFMMSTTSALKAESYLTASITAAVYHWLRYDQTSRLKHLWLGALWSGISAMTKGIFTLITIGSGSVILWVYQGRWRELFSLKWLIALVLSVLCMSPELWSLYQQFDLHPEKVAFGHSNVSGVKFFFWDSQFGRFLGTGPIASDSGDVYYFFHVFLWTFMPWSWAFVWGIWRAARRWREMRVQERDAWVFVLALFFVTFAMFSSTRFQLDYYTVIIYPFAAIACGRAIDRAQAEADTWMRWGNGVYALLVFGLASGVVAFAQLNVITWVWGASVVAALALMVVLRASKAWMSLVIVPALAANVLYGVSEIMTYVVFDRYSLTHHVMLSLEHEPALPVYFQNVDPIVPLEISLYRSVSSWDATQQPDRPLASRYHLVLTQAQQQTWAPPAKTTSRLVAQGCWIEHKTGVLIRTLHMLKGQEPCETYDILEVTTPNAQ